MKVYKKKAIKKEIKEIEEKTSTYSEWELDQQILCLYNGLKYEARIIEKNLNNPEFLYKIHYLVYIF